MDLSDYIKMQYREMYKATKISTIDGTRQEGKEKLTKMRKTKRDTLAFARRNIDENMSPYCTPQPEKSTVNKANAKSIQKTPKVLSEGAAKRIKMLAQWKAEKAKKKEQEKANQKPIFKVAHVPIELTLNLENVNTMIKGKSFSSIKKPQFAPKDHKFRAPRGIKPIEFTYTSTLSKVLNNATKSSAKFQKTSIKSEIIKNKNTVDGIAQRSLAKDKNVPSTSSRTIMTSSITKNETIEGAKKNKPTGHSSRVIDKPGTSSTFIYNTRANAKANSTNSSNQASEKQNKTKNVPKPGTSQTDSVKNASTNKPSKIGSTINSSKSQTLVTSTGGINGVKSTRKISAAKNSKSQSNIQKADTQANEIKNKLKPTFSNASTSKVSPKLTRAKTGKTQITPKIKLEVANSKEMELSNSQNAVTNKTPENKGTSGDFPTTTTYISPFVTISRGKRSARNEYKIRKSFSKEIATPEKVAELINDYTSAQAGANYFMTKLNSEIVRITEKCNEWEVYLQDQELPEIASSLIGAAIGQSKLLLSKKFEQFRGLIKQCLTQEYEEKEITCEDLHGFWDVIYMQVEDLDKRFANLQKLKDNNWSEMLPETKDIVKKPKARAKKIEAKSKIRDFVRAAKAKQKTENQEENVFIGGYYEVRTPVKEKLTSNSTGTDRRRRSNNRLSVLASEGKKRCSSSPGLTLMKVSQSIKQNNGLTPRKSILKVNGSKSTGKKMVVFKDSTSPTNLGRKNLFADDNNKKNKDVESLREVRKSTSFKEEEKENTPVRRSSRFVNQESNK